MCSHYAMPSLKEIKTYLTTDLKLPLIVPKNIEEKFSAVTQIYPKSSSLVMLYSNSELKLVEKKWGYPSPFQKNRVLYNARIERFYEEKPSMWDNSFARQRCIILANEFWESSKQTYLASNNQTYHEHSSFTAKEEPMTLIAGIYQGDDFSMVTTAANSTVLPVHERMPLVLKPSELRRWLFQNFTSLLNRSEYNLARHQLPHR